MEYQFQRSQNRIANVIEIKQFLWIRRHLLRSALRRANVFARVWLSQTYLDSIPGIRFARWVIFEQMRRLLYLTSCNGRSQEYLNDFVQFAHIGHDWM